MLLDPKLCRLQRGILFAQTVIVTGNMEKILIMCEQSLKPHYNKCNL